MTPVEMQRTQAWLDAATGPGQPRHYFTVAQTFARLTLPSTPQKTEPRKHTIAFAHAGSLEFEAGDLCRIQAYEDAAGKPAFVLMGTFMGLLGTTSPLPQVLIEGLCGASAPGAVRHFFDMVYARSMQHLVARYKQTHPAVGLRSDYTDVWSSRLLAWTPHVEGLSRALRWRYLRALVRGGAPAPRMCAVVQDVLARRKVRARVEVRAMTGGWTSLDAGATCVLGVRNRGLGQSSVLGDKAWAPKSAFSLDIHPATLGDYARLRRDFEAYDEVHAIVSALGPQQTRCDVHVWLEPGMAPAMRLDGRCRLGEALSLGSSKGLVRLAYTAPDRSGTQASAGTREV